ncbi:hypothetical protein ACOMHN_008431 [Nucella lapillus]
MNEPTEGRVLLVGEGNFSLSASLVEGGAISGPQMIATCRESFTAVQESHQLAASNINFLEKAGTTVLFEVDATDLHNNNDINFYQFERVIFNFPLADRHNIKKNRELLSDFFSSVKNILDPEKGQVMVTLCKGQGGTPADQPMRSWHDSWQVVSMAANAGFILKCISPFQAEQFVRYKSVGFRFQDKGFNTDSALTHVFEVAAAVSVPTVSSVRSVMTQDDQQFAVPAYVRRKHDRWSLLDKKDHPVCTLLHHITTHLSLTYLPSNSPLLPKILPGYTSSLSATGTDIGDEADNTDDNDDSGEPDDRVVTAGGGDGDAQKTVSQAGEGDGGPQAPSSKERKELENRQKVAAGSDNLVGAITDTHTSTGSDSSVAPGADMKASNGCQQADRNVASQPFQHGVERDGGEGGTNGRSMRKAVPTFPPLKSPTFVLHAVSDSSRSQAGHDPSSQPTPCSQIASGSKLQAADMGAGQTEETMETEEEKCHSSGDSPEAKRTKVDSDSVQSSFVPPVKALFHLRCSLLENLTHLRGHMKTKHQKSVFTSGIVYRKCPVCPSELAASHEALMLAETEGDAEGLTNQLNTALKAVMDKDAVTGLTVAPMAKSVSVGETGRLSVDAAFVLQSGGGHNQAMLGHIFTFKDHPDCQQGSDTASKPMLGAVLYLDTILLHALRLPDVRLLWSENKRFLEHFSKGSSPLEAFSTFRAFSMYPVRFVHDVSFWENPQRVFEEEEFFDVVREVTDDTVTKVSLVDRFDHADSGKTSRCYRLVFQSHDHALSYITSWRLQSMLRLKVAQQLGITLR